jgi:hypothetical protein
MLTLATLSRRINCGEETYPSGTADISVDNPLAENDRSAHQIAL